MVAIFVVKEVLSKVQTPYIHLRFDLDFMDVDEYTATGLPVPNGVSINDTKKCLKTLLQDERIISMDFVEYSPIRDKDNVGLNTCLELMESGF